MNRIVVAAMLLICVGWPAASQSGEPPRFAAADVHASPKTRNAFLRTGPVRDGRYVIKNATMVDLIRLANGIDANNIVGGPMTPGRCRRTR